jgi:hypothetical protein
MLDAMHGRRLSRAFRCVNAFTAFEYRSNLAFRETIRANFANSAGSSASLKDNLGTMFISCFV